MSSKKVAIIGGGTVFHVRSHLALCAPAYGGTARWLNEAFKKTTLEPELYLTRMAGGNLIETNEHILELTQRLVSRQDVRVIILSAAMCDFQGSVGGAIGKTGQRLSSRKYSDPECPLHMVLTPAEKVIESIRKHRKSVFLVGFKSTNMATEDDQYKDALGLCKRASCNLVFANDAYSRKNMIVTPEEARYHVTTDHNSALQGLVEMVVARSQLNFTRSTVMAGDPIPWSSPMIPMSLKRVVNYCISQNAYRPFNGVTAGHFACNLGSNVFLTSIRKTNFNDLEKVGLVMVKTDGDDNVLAYGAKPSVGGQSQRIVFKEHDGFDCIVHFHCPIKPGSDVPAISQREFECGSHECGARTSKGLKQFGNLKAVYLDNHGPNIVFPASIDPKEVINFIEANFDLTHKTGGYVA
jgi:hypothetical protein